MADHGGHWGCFGGDSSEIISTFLGECVEKGRILNQQSPTIVSQEPFKGGMISAIVYPESDLKGMVLVAHGCADGKNYIYSGYPYAETGIVHEVEIENIESTVDSAEGIILGTIAGCAPISFFDTHYYKNRDKYHPKMKAKFMLSGLVYLAGTPIHKEVVINDPDKIKAMRQASRPDAPNNLEPIKISLEGSAILFNREDLSSDDYDFMVTIDEKKRLNVLGYEINRIKATLMRPDQYDFSTYLYIADSALQDGCTLEVGKSISGVLWLQGYLVE